MSRTGAWEARLWAVQALGRASHALAGQALGRRLGGQAKQALDRRGEARRWAGQTRLWGRQAKRLLG